MVSAGMRLVKYLLFIFNFIFWVTGVAILAFGIWIQVEYKHYFLFVGNQFVSAPILLIIIGSVITVIAFFGCCGAIRENHCMIVTFAVLLAIIFILELAAGIAAYVLRNDLKEVIEQGMSKGMERYGYKNATDVTKTWDAVQHDLNCCGMNGTASWQVRFPPNEVPDTCCVNDKEGCGKDPKSELHTEGCFGKFFRMSSKTAYIVGGVGIGVAFVQIIGIVFACCLSSAIKREYEIV